MGDYFVNLTCTEINQYCPIQDTIYGYYPSLGFNAFFVAMFSLFAIVHAALAIKYRTLFLGIVLTSGSIAEAIGYAGRILLWRNPFDGTGFSIQISCLIFAPSFIAAAVYITFKDLVTTFGAEVSRLKPLAYAWIFIGCDIVCLVLQAVGGGMAGSAGTDKAKRDLGTNMMISGIVIQVVTLMVFAGMVADYVYRRSRQWIPEATRALTRQTKFRAFVAGVTLAYLAIFTRCVYRIPELVDGWGSPLMKDETTFIGLEGFMVVIATFCFIVFHPGFCLKAQPGSYDEKQNTTRNDKEEESG